MFVRVMEHLPWFMLLLLIIYRLKEDDAEICAAVWKHMSARVLPLIQLLLCGCLNSSFKDPPQNMKLIFYVILTISCKGSYRDYELLTQLLQRLQAFNSMVTKLEHPWRSVWSLQSFMMTLRPPNWNKFITKNKTILRTQYFSR